SITGTVKDADTGSPLPGVNIVVKNTVLGASTDVEGKFRISGLRPGTYTIVVSMIGYKVETFEHVQVQPGRPVVLNIRLHQSYVEISPVVVTASRKSESLAETPNSVSLVSALDIRTRNSVDVRDALKYAPGVSFMAGQVNIRGTTGYSRGAGSRVLLLTDGVPTMPGDSGDIKWDVVPAMAVEKVEVVKGAASALYGSSAIGGVLNILTRDPSSKPEWLFRFSGGMYDQPIYKQWKWTDQTLWTNQQDVFFSNTQGSLGYILAGGRRFSRGYKQGAQYTRWNVFGKARYKFTSSSNLSVTASYARDDHGVALLWQSYLGQPKQPFRVPQGEEQNTILSTKLFVNSTFNHLASQNFAYKIRASLYRNRFDNHFVDNQDFSVARRYRAEFQGDLEPSVLQSITFGAEIIYDKITGNFYGGHEAMIAGGYLQDELKITDRFSTTGGLRLDYSHVVSGRTQYQLSPKLGVIYRLSRATTLKGSVGKGFRAPSVAELFSNTSASGFRVLPNPQLRPERSWSAEVGITTTFRNAVSFSLALYQERYYDFINPSFQVQNLRPLIQFNNVQDARIRGLEADATMSWFKRLLTTSVSYVYVVPRDLQTHRLLTYRPQHILTVSVALRRGIFELGADFRYLSRLKKEQVEVFPQDERVATKVLDAHAGLRKGSYMLMFNAENLLQYNYVQVERNLEPIRHFSLSFQRSL
ncbi:MAG: TonB-dependent receptor, partial [Calditrichaeota bacterium]